MDIHAKILKILIILIFFIAGCLPLCNKAYSQQAWLLTPEYVGLIQQRISSCFIYPPEALAKGWEGVVKVKVILADDGRIKEIDIAESSGYPLLDAAAILAIKDASPYPFPKDYNYAKDGVLELILPLNYTQSNPETDVIPEQSPMLSPYQENIILPEEAKESANISYAQEASMDSGEIKENSPNSYIDKELTYPERNATRATLLH
jgi:TonB family protein